MKGQFQICYKLGVEQPEYVPDFVVERADVDAVDVRAKADAGALWCRHASDYSAKVNGKPWQYLLVPHDQVTQDKALNDYLRFEIRV